MTSAATLAADFRARRATPAEELERRLADIARRNPALRAFTHVDAEGACRQARDATSRFAQGRPLSPLDGVPVAIKDNIAVKGLPHTAGMAHRRDVVAADDSVAVARLRAAGAVLIGMVNMHEAALGATTDNPFYGRTDNPAAPGCTPGGSSGGSAAAVAAGFVPIALGTDTMGSVRLPAAYCRVVGFKPTTGRVPTAGLVELSSTLDCIGPIAGDVDDCLATLAVIAEEASEAPLAGSSLGRVRLPEEAACEPSVTEAVERAIESLKQAGVAFADVAIPTWHPSRDRRMGLLIVEAEGAVVHAEALRARAPMSDSLRAMLAYGQAIPEPKLAAAYQRIRDLAATVRRIVGAFDALVLPTAPQVPFLHGVPAPSNQADYTSLASFAGLPAISLPIPSAAGPTGLQLIGRHGSDRALARLARRVAEALSR